MYFNVSYVKTEAVRHVDKWWLTSQNLTFVYIT